MEEGVSEIWTYWYEVVDFVRNKFQVFLHTHTPLAHKNFRRRKWCVWVRKSKEKCVYVMIFKIQRMF